MSNKGLPYSFWSERESWGKPRWEFVEEISGSKFDSQQPEYYEN